MTLDRQYEVAKRNLAKIPSRYGGVPTNAELEADAPDTVLEAVRNWLKRHPRPFFGNDVLGYDKWLDFAASNLINDPEIRGAWKKEHNAATE